MTRGEDQDENDTRCSPDDTRLSDGQDLVPQGVGAHTADDERSEGHDDWDRVERDVKGERLGSEVGDPRVEAWCGETAVG